MTPVESVVDKRRWWKEVLFVLAFYVVYARIRNQFGSNGLFAATTTTAADNARRVIDFEKQIGLFFEENLQEAFWSGIGSFGFGTSSMAVFISL